VSAGLRRVLVLVPGPLGENLSGPEIRGWEFAKALSSAYEVTIAANRSSDCEREGIRVVASSRRRIAREAMHHDAVISGCLPPYLLALKPLHRFLAISDQYDPHELELATLDAGRRRDRALRSRAAIQSLQLRSADVVLCAGERQREELIRASRSIGQERALDPVVLPFGISERPRTVGLRPLHERFAQLADSDTVVLWWGSVWRWLDAETPVRALALLAASHPEIKLVITAGKPSNKSAERLFDATEEIRSLASELGVLGRNVLFLDEWIPYQERYEYMGEANIGLTLHRHADEARLAARARYMDYLSAGLPCVLGRGDETAEEFGRAGFASLLEDPDAEQLAALLIALAEHPERLATARLAGERLAAEYSWSAVGAKLRAAVAEAAVERPSRPPLLGATARYYARRLVDHLVAAG